MSTIIPADFSQRNRTLADRRAFLLSENTASTIAQLNANSVEPAAPEHDFSASLNPSAQRTRNRAQQRAIAESTRQESFIQVIAETVFRALPLDAHEKAPFHETVIAQTREIITQLPSADWKLSPLGEALLDESIAVVDRTADAGYVGYLADLKTAMLAENTIGALVEDASTQIMERVVEAVVNSRERAAELEDTLAESADSDAELTALRQSRLLKENVPSIMESLFIANSRSLNEGTGGAQLDSNLIMVEAVCQYALIETLSAVGIMDLSSTEATMLARRLQNTK